jgi:hypothetical protein
MFRMPTLSHFQSYSRIPQVLEQCVLDALASRRRLDHTLVHGHAGTGKWLLAQALVRDYAPPQAIELDARRGSCPEALWHCIQIVGNGGILVIRHIDKLDPMSERLLEVTLDPRLRTPDAPIPSALRMIMQRTNPYATRSADIDRALEELHELESDDEKSAGSDCDLNAERGSTEDSGRGESRGRGPKQSDDAPDAESDGDDETDGDADEAMDRRRRASRRAALDMQGLPVPTSEEHRRKLSRAWRRVPAFTLVATSEDCDSVDDALLQRFERRTHLRNDPKALRTVLIRALQAKGVTLAPDALPLAERVLASVIDGTEPLVRAIVTRAAIEDADRIDAELFRSIAHEDLADILPTESFARSLLLLHPPQRLARADDAAIDAMAERHCWSPSTVRSAVLTIHRLSWVEHVNASIAASFEIETKKPTPPIATPIDDATGQQAPTSNAVGEVSSTSPAPSDAPMTPVAKVSTPTTPTTVETPASSAIPTTPASPAEISAMEPVSQGIDATAPTNLEAECPAPTVHARDPLGAHDPSTSDGPGPSADLTPHDRDDLAA